LPNIILLSDCKIVYWGVDIENKTLTLTILHVQGTILFMGILSTEARLGYVKLV